MERKYEFTGETRPYCGKTLYRIKALKDFADIKAGDLGGWIESENNLSHRENCWVYNDAIVKDKAVIEGNAKILDNAEVSEKAVISNNAIVKDCALVSDYAFVGYNAKVYKFGRVLNNSALIYDAEATKEVINFGNAFNSYGFDRIVISDKHIMLNHRQFTKEELRAAMNHFITKHLGTNGLKLWLTLKPLLLEMNLFEEVKES